MSGRLYFLRCFIYVITNPLNYFSGYTSLFLTSWLRKLSFKEAKAIAHRVIQLVSADLGLNLGHSDSTHESIKYSKGRRGFVGGVVGSNIVGNAGIGVREMKRE